MLGTCTHLPHRVDPSKIRPESEDKRTYQHPQTMLYVKEKAYYLFWAMFLKEIISKGVSTKPAMQAIKRKEADVSEMVHFPTDLIVSQSGQDVKLSLARRTRLPTEIPNHDQLSAQEIARIGSTFYHLQCCSAILRERYADPRFVFTEGEIKDLDDPQNTQWLRERGMLALAPAMRDKQRWTAEQQRYPFTYGHVAMSSEFWNIWFQTPKAKPDHAAGVIRLSSSSEVSEISQTDTWRKKWVLSPPSAMVSDPLAEWTLFLDPPPAPSMSRRKSSTPKNGVLTPITTPKQAGPKRKQAGKGKKASKPVPLEADDEKEIPNIERPPRAPKPPKPAAAASPARAAPFEPHRPLAFHAQAAPGMQTESMAEYSPFPNTSMVVDERSADDE